MFNYNKIDGLFEGNEFLVDTNFILANTSILVFLTALAGILLEEHLVIRIIVLFEISLAAIVGYLVTLIFFIGAPAGVLAIICLVIAAVESIILFGFVVLLHYLNQISEMANLSHLQA